MLKGNGRSGASPFGLRRSDLSRHELRLQELRSSPFRVTIRTMAGMQCGPPGVGEITPDGDFKLTCPPHLTVGDVLSMQHWNRFSADEERRSQREAGEKETWWHPLGIEIMALVFDRGAESCIAAHSLPIGYCGASVTALAYNPGELANTTWAKGKPVDTMLLESALTPPTPRSVVSSGS